MTLSVSSATPVDPVVLARRARALLDLTDLSDTCTATAVDALCRDAKTGRVAAICVWPQFVKQGAQALAPSGVRVATVVNFPTGGEDVDRAVEDTGQAIADGAHEVDLVLPYRALLRGDVETARTMVAEVRDVCRRTCLKVILETGTLASPALIEAASRLALEEGADFVKTSTGKSPVSATPEAAAAMLGVLRAHGSGGLKVSGGIRTREDAATYLALADEVMGPGWVSAKTFRIGASTLYAELAAAADPA